MSWQKIIVYTVQKCACSLHTLQRGVEVAEGAEEAGGAEKAVGSDHEVRVGVEVVERLELGHDLLEEAAGVLLVEGSKLSKPDGLAVAGLVGVLEVVEQGVGVLRLRVPVNGAEVDLAATLSLAGAHELFEPVDALVRVATVGDGGRTNLGLVGVLGKVLLVSSSGSRGGHVGLASIVGLVEAHQVLSAIVQTPLGIRVPSVGVNRNVTPEHGDVGHVLGIEKTRVAVPVESPSAALASAAKEVGEKTVVVSHTTLGGGPGAGGGRRSGRRLIAATTNDGKIRQNVFRLGLWLRLRLRLRLRLDLRLRLGLRLGLRLDRCGHGGSRSWRRRRRRSLGRGHSDGRGDGGSMVHDKVGLRRRNRLASSHVDSVVNGDPVDVDVTTLSLVKVTVGVEGLGRASEGSQGNSRFGVHGGVVDVSRCYRLDS